MVIQAIALLDTLDKDINTFVMRVREWYSWHFPELVRVVADNYLYARLTLLIRDKAALSEAMLPGAAALPRGPTLPYDRELAQDAGLRGAALRRTGALARGHGMRVCIW